MNVMPVQPDLVSNADRWNGFRMAIIVSLVPVLRLLQIDLEILVRFLQSFNKVFRVGVDGFLDKSNGTPWVITVVGKDRRQLS